MQSPPPQLPVAMVLCVLTLCGAMILILFDIWLRRRDVKDSSLFWMSLSLLSWSVGGAAQTIDLNSLTRIAGIEPKQVVYLLSPISTVLLTMTAFRLARVRELFHSSELKTWPRHVVGFVLLLSVVALVLTLLKHSAIGNIVDAIASSLALTVLGCGLTYSFYKYGNHSLAGLTGIVITLKIAHQYGVAAYGQPQGILAAANVGIMATLTMLFIALTVAWGLSDTSRSKPIGTPLNVNVIAMYFDLRGSTKWSSEILKGDFSYVGDFIDKLRAWAWNQTAVFRLAHPKVKFLGDGFLFVWEIPRGETPLDQAMVVVKFAYSLSRNYPSWAADERGLWRGVPSALGVGIDVGPAIRLTFESGTEDYIGAPMNIAAKMQDLARPCGGIVVSAELWSRFNSETGELFPKTGVVNSRSGDQFTVYATEEVEFPC